MLASSEQLTPTGSPIVPALAAGWALRPGVLFTLGDRKIEGESTLDVMWRDPFGRPGAQVRFNAKLSIPIIEPIALTVGYTAFARRDRFIEVDAAMNTTTRDVWGFAGDLNIGLRLTYARALQMFSF
jgi:hypothetical protein